MLTRVEDRTAKAAASREQSTAPYPASHVQEAVQLVSVIRHVSRTLFETSM